MEQDSSTISEQTEVPDDFESQLPALEDILETVTPTNIPGIRSFIPDSQDDIRQARPTGKSERFIVFETEHPREAEHRGFTEIVRRRTIQVKDQYRTASGIRYWKVYQETEYSVVVTNHNIVNYEIIEANNALDKFKGWFNN